MTPVDPTTPEALARDPAVRDALNEFVEDWATAGEAFARNHLISTILARYRATRATTGPVLSFEAARAEAIARSAAGYDTEAHAYDAALEQQAAERVGALEARIKELELAAFPTGDASDRDTLKQVRRLIRPNLSSEHTDNLEAPR